MDELEASVLALEIIETHEDQEVRALSATQALQAVRKHLAQQGNGRPGGGRRVYSDPTATEAIGNLMRSGYGRARRYRA